ncbi:hypothetical protein MF271_18925 (plasmid) [Deinococcus sp. KNUC1210]|uniref:hypothetical protein n=1 Tax=Deinococcus sp. KNUC1210 TaxID=2917691 RepID=UPI001EF04985|nr:hypothetical protein [Deinococcus sp. KNUC1210]ULH17395.1 hypothetical protein MF271_18925 [Deinococcus sp. KNUC1210]
MTAALSPPWLDEDDPPLMPVHVSVLSQVLARLIDTLKTTGQPQHHTFSKGLIVTAYLQEGALRMALTREGGEPSLTEGDIVARDAGWRGYNYTWKTGSSGTRGLVLRPAQQAPALPKGQKLDYGLTPEQRAAILEVFKQTPRRPGTMTPEYAQTFYAAREAGLKAMSNNALLEELDWLWRHWGGWIGDSIRSLEQVMTYAV